MGVFLLLPFFLLRFGLMAWLDRDALIRAARFPPLRNGERAAYWIYQISTAALILGLCFSRVKPSRVLLSGAVCYLLGLLLLAGSITDFCAPAEDGFRQKGLYRFSRNPMYAAYFVLFAGTGLLTASWSILGCLLCFQISSCWIVRAEERWCLETFGEAYRQYMGRVRRWC